MKEMIKRIREERGGFTIAELLIVVAIIMVLVAIAIPVFTSALHNAKWSADEANARSIYGDMQADYLANGANGQSDGFGLSATTMAEQGEIVVTENDGTTNTYKFSGDTTVTITEADGATPPSVEISCNNGDHDTETFGA